LTNDSGFLTAEVDGDNSNELQTISKSGSTITLSDNGGSVTVFDGNYSNLTNAPSIPANTSDLTNDSGFLTAEVDGDNSNELQTLSRKGDTIKLTDGGYVLLDPVVSGSSGSSGHIDGLVDARNDSIDDNLSFGAQAFDALTSGNSNLAIGNSAAKSMTGGSRNIAIGKEALLGNTTGEDNVAIGTNSLRSNTTGYDNIGVGNGALFQNTTGYWNVALGREAMSSNTTGSANVALGRFALMINTTGYDNVAIGPEALGANETGNFNTTMGRMALRLNKTGGQNTMIGAHAGFYLNASGLNSALGYNAMHDLRVGNDNVAVGALSGDNFRRGKENVFIGRSSGSVDTTLNNTVVLGYNVRAAQSNAIYIGNSSQTELHTPAKIFSEKGLEVTNNSTSGGSAIVEMNSTTKGMLMPRMTQTQRKAISSPDTGLMVYQTDNTQKGVHFYDGTGWRYLGVGVSSN